MLHTAAPTITDTQELGGGWGWVGGAECTRISMKFMMCVKAGQQDQISSWNEESSLRWCLFFTSSG